MMSRAICASLLLVMLAYAAAVGCFNDCTNESNALLQIHTPMIKEDMHEKKRWRRWRRRWRRRYYAPHTTSTTTTTTSTTSTSTTCFCRQGGILTVQSGGQLLGNADEITFTFPVDVPECCCIGSQGVKGAVKFILNGTSEQPVAAEFNFQFTNPNNLTRSSDSDNNTLSIESNVATISSAYVLTFFYEPGVRGN